MRYALARDLGELFGFSIGERFLIPSHTQSPLLHLVTRNSKPLAIVFGYACTIMSSWVRSRM
jgi:hypothetical protein